MYLPVLLVAMIEALAMLLVAIGYFFASRRWSVLKHPLSIVCFVTVVGVVVSVLGELWRDGPTGAPEMARRSAIGSAAWGALIAGVAWVLERSLARRRR